MAVDRPSNWLHDRKLFFKYVTRDTALAILENGTLQWSAPNRFNDPFDMQFTMSIGNAYERLRPRILDALWAAHSSSDGYTPGNELGDAIARFRSQFPKMSRADFDREFTEALDQCDRTKPEREVNASLKVVARFAKVLCLSERKR